MLVVTFDIWDTCLARTVARPRDVFAFAAARVLGLDDPFSPAAAELARQRVAAERRARESAPQSECTLAEIEAMLAALTTAEIAARFIAAELDTERAVIRPIRAIAETIAAARATGARVAFVSDMYLPSSFLQELLLATDLARAEERVFVSCEHRANKHSGALFEIVQRELGATPAQWTHHGDHPHSDVSVPTGRGIAGRHFTRGTPTEVELAVRERFAAQPALGSLLSGVLRAARLAGSPQRDGAREAWLTGVAAPWLCALAWRAVRRAEAAGIKRLYFLSRDAEILLRLARKFAPAGLECRYLYSSRRAWCRAAMLADDKPSWRWLKVGSPSVLGLLRSLGFDSAERDAIVRELALTPVDAARPRPAAELEFVWNHLRIEHHLTTALERASIARSELVAYLKQEGLHDDTPFAIVDVGWSLNSQSALHRLLGRAGAPHGAHGFYFMAREDRPPLEETGPFDAWLVQEACGTDAGATGDLFAWQSGLIEECLLTNSDPSLAGFRAGPEGRFAPQFTDEKPNATTATHAAELREAAEALADELVRTVDRSPALAPRDTLATALETQALAELIRFLRRPTAGEASAIAALAHSTDATGTAHEARPIARPYTLGDALSIFLRRAKLRRRGLRREPLWSEGSFALTSPLAAKAMRCALAPLSRKKRT